MGTVAAHTARATFATNLFAAGGVAVEVAGADRRASTTCWRRTTASRSSAWPAPTRLRRVGRRPGGRAPRRRARHVILAGKPAGPRGRRLLRDGRRCAGLPAPDEGEAGMSVPKSFAGPAAGREVRRSVPNGRPRGPRKLTVWYQTASPGTARRGSTSCRSTGRSTSTASTRSTPGPGSARSCAVPTRRCTPPSRGRSASTPGSPPPRSPTRSTGATWRPARRA